MNTNIIREHMSTTFIGDTGVSVQDLIDSLCDIMDGIPDHDIAAITGLPDSCANKISNVRNQMLQFWDA